MTTDDLTIRQLDPCELEHLEPLWNALREHHVAVVPELGEPRPRDESCRRRRAQYDAWLQEPTAFGLVAERGGDLVGYAMVHLRVGSPTWPLSEQAGELETLSVLPRERGQGVGTALLEAVRRELRARGATELSLHVVPGSIDTLRFYERHGFDVFALWLTSQVAAPDNERTLRAAYSAFNARDIDAAVALMHPEVDWPNAWEGDRALGRAAVRDYWRRQFAAVSSTVEPERFIHEPDGSVTVEVHQVVHDGQTGALISDSHVRHRFRFSDGLVRRMDVLEAADRE